MLLLGFADDDVTCELDWLTEAEDVPLMGFEEDDVVCAEDPGRDEEVECALPVLCEDSDITAGECEYVGDPWEELDVTA